VVENFHFFYGDVFFGVLVLGEEDDAVCALAQGLEFLVVAYEAAV